MRAYTRKRDFSDFLNEPWDPAQILTISHARDLLFDTILHQLATSSLFSNSDHAPSIFIVYAHDNEKEGDAHDACVRTMISWLKEINAQILSDQSPMPLHRPRIEGTGAIHNILQNQICLLPATNDDNETPIATSVDKVIVCGSEVLQRYCGTPSAMAYIEEIVQICVDGADQSRIKSRVEAECGNHDFHHILTELAFLEFRKSCLPEKDSMVPIMLSQAADEAPMQYLPIFDNTDVKLKLKSPAAIDLHRLFFKLLEQLFPADGEFIRPFRQCYESISSRLDMEHEVTWEWFNNIVSRSITDTYQTYWARFCVAVRDGKLQAYTGKLGHDVSALHLMQSLQETHTIMRWLSPVSALERHGRFHNKGTSRLAGTCNWIIQGEKFRQWYDCEGSTLLILCGYIGTGKTYCTSRVIDWVQEGLSTNAHSEGFAYFYCNKQDSTSDDPCRILRNLIRQLATGPWTGTSTGDINTVHKSVYELWKAGNGPGIISTFAQWEECLVALINTYPRTTIVLDALDECGEVEQKALIELILNLASPESKYKPVKIFMSTRPEVLQKHHLDEYPAIQMQQNHHANDIAAFVRTKITDHPRWSKMTMGFQTEIVDTLLKRSGDMFLFASLQTQQLLHCDTEADLRECLVGLPKSLEETYEEIYQRATAPGKDRKKLLDRALRWVLCAARPLTTDELLFAISQDFESDTLVPLRWDLDEAWIENLCHNFLSLESSRAKNGASVWRLAHQAVADFLEKSNLCEKGYANYQAGTICLAIVLDIFGESPSDDNYDSDEKGNSLEGRQCPCGERFMSGCFHAGLKTPLADYATHAWPTHLRALKSDEASGDDRLSQTLQKFLGEAGGTSLAYEKWRQHTDEINWYDDAGWSIFLKRTPPPTSLDNNNNASMSHISLASYLGFSFLLKQCLRFSGVELKTSHRAVFWAPWRETRGTYFTGTFPGDKQPLWWSLTALACAHNETEILEHLFDQGAERNTTKEDEVPPIVAAAIGDSKEAAEFVLNRGTALCSPFTQRHGHVLALTIKFKSLKVLQLLLNHIRNSSDPLEIDRGLSEVRIRHFGQDPMRVMLEAGVKVDMPLKDGTMLIAAVKHGWEDLVCHLLKQGADVNVRFGNSRNRKSAAYHDALEASLKHPVGSTRGQLDSLVYLLLDQPQTRVSTRHVGWACEFDRNELVLQKLLEHHPDLNEPYTLNGNATSALIQAVRSGNEKNTRLLIENNADVNLQLGGRYGDALSATFWTILTGFRKDRGTSPYPAGSIIELLIQGGASLDKLMGNHLNIALAAAAHAGLGDTVQECLKLGADPNAFCDHEYTTALGAAAASDHLGAPGIILILLDNGADINAYFPTYSDGWSSRRALALDFPLQAMLERGIFSETSEDHYKRLTTNLQFAEILVLRGAIWDIDFAQWRKCLEKQAPGFSWQNIDCLNLLLTMLKCNRSSFFQSVTEATNNKHWRIKCTRLDHHEFSKRPVLNLMHGILRESSA